LSFAARHSQRTTLFVPRPSQLATLFTTLQQRDLLFEQGQLLFERRIPRFKLRDLRLGTLLGQPTLRVFHFALRALHFALLKDLCF